MISVPKAQVPRPVFREPLFFIFFYFCVHQGPLEGQIIGGGSRLKGDCLLLPSGTLP